MNIRAIALVVLLIAPVLRGSGGEPPDHPTSLQVMQALAKGIGREVRSIVPALHDSSLMVTVVPKETAWPLELDFVSGLGVGAARGVADEASVVSVEIGVLSARVELGEIWRDGFFGPRVVDRTVELAVRVKVTGGSVQTTLYREFQRESRDTVIVSELDQLETAGLPMTRATVPSQGFFDDIVEPVILIGSIGMAVYLLFAVRS